MNTNKKTTTLYILMSSILSLIIIFLAYYLNFWLFAMITTILIITLGFFVGRKVTCLQSLLDQDYLTGLYNQRYLRKYLQESLERIHLKDKQISLLIIDIDHMKKINDKYGHLEGDRILILLADLISQIFPMNSTAVRWGGEEYVIIVPELSNQEVYDYALALQEKAKNSADFYHNTISIGMVTTSDSMDMVQLFDIADQALYRAKLQRDSIINVGDLRKGDKQ